MRSRDQRPAVGERWLVKWRDGSTHLAEVIEVREAKGGRAPAGVQDYYVHYVGHDRRLDEWAPEARVCVDKGVQLAEEPSEGQGSGRRGHKRRRGRAVSEPHSAAHAALEREHQALTKLKNIGRIELGRFEIDAWYYSPFPEEYCQEKLYVCEYCLKYMRHRKTLARHCESCGWTSPPGREIYYKPSSGEGTSREEGVAVYEVDGSEHKVYCQNLCLLSKLFLDHKTLYYDVDPFLFYVLCRRDGEGSHIVGYFSKEKDSAEGYNLACILTFPPFQRCGYGKFLISLSYELSKVENKVGSPEKPLSDLGKISYRSYWAYVLLRILKDRKDCSMQEVSLMTAIRTEDIISTLQSLKLIRFWKGQHVVCISQGDIDRHYEDYKAAHLCDPDFLHWTPPEVSAKKAKAAP